LRKQSTLTHKIEVKLLETILGELTL